MRSLIWKLGIVVVVLALSGLMLSVKGLKPGIDLAGGTTLVYEVQVPQGANAQEVIEETIAALRTRIDPTGVRNLVWRPEAGNRLSVQMAQASREVRELRDRYQDALDELLGANLDPREVVATLEAPADEREARVAALINAGADEQQLARTVEAYDALQVATTTLDDADDALRAVAEGDAEALEAARAARNEAQSAYVAARDAYREAEDALLASNVDPEDLQRVLDQPAIQRGQTAAGEGEQSPRQVLADRLAEEHPQQADLIREVVTRWTAYDEVRGQLDDPEDLKALLQGSGVLEFRIAAVPGETEPGPYVQSLDERGPRGGRDDRYRWFVVDNLDQYINEPADRRAVVESLEVLSLSDDEQIRAEAQQTVQQIGASVGVIARGYAGQMYVLLGNDEDIAVTGEQDWQLADASRGSDELMRPAVNFSLDARGGNLLGAVTGPNRGRPMAVVLDGRVITTPTLQARISDRGQITGNFSNEETDYMIRTMDAGSLAGELSSQPISQRTTGPSLGQDNLDAGVQASVLALVAVCIFMLVYYLFAGLVADLALAMNMLILLGIMSMLEATFTLPGIAGLVLTIGMAVDANVLIFERIREELDEGVKLTAAVRSGYGKALSTILDANITTLITCLVLGYTATAEVKGFAVVLGVGILATLFTTLFAGRIFVELYVRFSPVRQLHMLPNVIPPVGKLLRPNVDWLSKRKMFFPISVVLITAGITALTLRGGDMFDIEFRSGTQVTFNLRGDQMMPLSEVRDRLDAASAAALATAGGQDADDEVVAEVVERVQDRREAEGEMPVDWSLIAGDNVVTVGDTENVEGGVAANGFTVSTLVEDSTAVAGIVQAAFEDVLDATPSVAFAGQGLDPANAQRFIYAIDADRLDEVIDPYLQNLDRRARADQLREAAGDAEVTAMRGGVAIVLDNLQPALSVEQLSQRVTRMRQQPEFRDLPYRDVRIIGLEPADLDAEGRRQFRTLAYLVTDPTVNLAEESAAITDSQGLPATEWELVGAALERASSLASVNNFSSQVSGTMQQQAIVAIVLSLLAVVAYIWLRFGSLRYGLAAIAALVHDVTLTLGLLAVAGVLTDNAIGRGLLLSDFKIDLALVAAVLTIIGYSLNDTIIVFDRIRENRGRLARATPGIINDSINQTVSRTVITSTTTILALLILYTLGGPGVHGFAFAMLIGVLVGTYSSIAIAAPLLLIGSKAPAGREPATTGGATPAPA
jgi:SecD/SecF fusion protein